MSYQFGNTVVTDGLVFYQDGANTLSYPGSGTAVSDVAGDYADGTLTNGASHLTANGGSFDFDGTDDYLTTDLSDIYTYIGAFTVSYWIKSTATTTSQVFGVVSGTTGAPNFFSEAFLVTLNRTFSAETSGYTRLFLRDEGPSGNGSSLNTMVASFPCGSNDGQWHNVVLAYDNSATPVLTAYVDGVSKTVSYATTRDQINLSYVNNPAERNPCSACVNGRDDAKTGFLDGSLAAFSMYDRVLSSSEVTQNYNALRNRFA